MNLTGQKYGKLYVVEKTKEKTKKGDYKYRIQKAFIYQMLFFDFF